MKEPITKKLDRVRSNLLSRLTNHPPSDGIPNDLKNAVATYLLLEPDDREVRQAYDKLLGGRNSQLKQT